MTKRILRIHRRTNNYKAVGLFRRGLNTDVHAFIYCLKAQAAMNKNILDSGGYRRFSIRYRTLAIAKLVDYDVEILPQETSAPFSTPNEIQELLATGQIYHRWQLCGSSV